MIRWYLDMDGVMADFDRGYMERWVTHPRDESDDQLWNRINSCPEFFPELKPCEGALEFLAWAAQYINTRPVILTACPRSNYPDAARCKREWVRKNLSEDLIVLPVMGGANKPLFMHAPGDVLIDDYRRNVSAWEGAGGVGILHRSWAATKEELLDAMMLAAAVDDSGREPAPYF